MPSPNVNHKRHNPEGWVGMDAFRRKRIKGEESLCMPVSQSNHGNPIPNRNPSADLRQLLRLHLRP
eukprot:966080-Amorphochlora_amoeboformis.AAC.1